MSQQSLFLSLETLYRQTQSKPTYDIQVLYFFRSWAWKFISWSLCVKSFNYGLMFDTAVPKLPVQNHQRCNRCRHVVVVKTDVLIIAWVDGLGRLLGIAQETPARLSLPIKRQTTQSTRGICFSQRQRSETQLI